MREIVGFEYGGHFCWIQAEELNADDLANLPPCWWRIPYNEVWDSVRVGMCLSQLTWMSEREVPALFVRWQYELRTNQDACIPCPRELRSWLLANFGADGEAWQCF